MSESVLGTRGSMTRDAIFETLIQHFPLEEVLEFVGELEAVRTMIPQEDEAETEKRSLPTIRPGRVCTL